MNDGHECVREAVPALAVGELGGVILPQDTGTWKLGIDLLETWSAK